MAKTAVLISTLMIPLVVYSPLPRFHPRSWFVTGKRAVPVFEPRRFAEAGSEAATGNSQTTANVSGESSWRRLYDPANSYFWLTWRGCPSRLGWILLGFWALGWLIGRSSKTRVRQRRRSIKTSSRQVDCRVRLPVEDLVSVRFPFWPGLVHPDILIASECDRAEFDRESPPGCARP